MVLVKNGLVAAELELEKTQTVHKDRVQRGWVKQKLCLLRATSVRDSKMSMVKIEFDTVGMVKQVTETEESDSYDEMKPDATVYLI